MRLLLFITALGFALAELEHHASELEVIEHNPEEGEFFEGDMLLPYNPFTRNAKKNDYYKWPGATVYYEIDNTGFSSSDLAQIQKGISEYHAKTCIRFVKRTNQNYWVKISRASAGCFATVGKVSRNNSPQRINLGRGCTTRLGTVVHEMAHMLGFHHEQSRPDRDQHVTIMTQNIQSGKSGNFRKYTTNDVTTLNLPYDYGSVMHYGSHSFSANGQATIVPKQKGASIGQRNGFSSLDLQKLNAYYCAGGKTGAPVTTQKPGATTKPTTTAPQTGSAFRCDFSKDICGMTQSKTDKLDWTRLNGGTASTNTGPSSGQYIYVEASAKAPNDSASIVTPAVSVSAGKYALRFKYHMYGSTMGTLNAFFILGSQQYNFFKRSGDQGNSWKDYCTSLSVSGSATLRMGFVGIVGSSFRSDIAVDDVSIIKGDCGSNPPVTTVKPAVTGNTLLSCTFETNTCGMTINPTSGYSWRSRSGATPSSNTGPTSDANNNAAGKYMYTEASGSTAGAIATMTTPQYTLAGGVGCLEFAFHMYGASMGKLNVYYQFGSQARRTLYSVSGDKGNRWLRSRINLSGASVPIRFIFEGTRGNSFTSDIAVDNISLKNQAC